jgi:hypothetical protein
MTATRRSEYPVGTPSGTCHATGRPIPPGDAYVAVLAEREGELRRLDFAAEAFEERDDHVAIWRGTSRGDTAGDRRRARAETDELLLDLVRRDDADAGLRWAAALLLRRRRKLVDLGDNQYREVGTGTVHYFTQPDDLDDEHVGRQLADVLGEAA